MSRNTCTKEDVLEACYHEVGHLLAASMFQPFSDRITGIGFNLKPNGSRGAHTELSSLSFNYKNGEYQGYKYICLCGGVFQQMKLLNNSLLSGQIRYNIIERIKSCKNPDSALRHFFIRKIVIPYDGMQEDLSGLYSVQNAFSSHFQESLDLNTERLKAIDLLFPYVKCPIIEKLCIDCRDYFWEEASNGKNPILFSKEKIDTYLQNKDCAFETISNFKC